MRSAIAPYGIGMGSVIVATAGRALLDPFLQDNQIFALYYAAVAVTAWYGGLRPALAALLAGGLAGDWFFAEPRGSLVIAASDVDGWIRLAVYSVVSLAIAVCIEAIRRATRPAIQLASEDDAKELLAVASAIRTHRIGSRELGAYLEGLNASQQMFAIAATYEPFDLDADELAPRLEALVGQGEQRAAASSV